MSGPCFDKDDSPFVLYCLYGHLFRYHISEPLCDRQNDSRLAAGIFSVYRETDLVGGGNLSDGMDPGTGGADTYTGWMEMVWNLSGNGGDRRMDFLDLWCADMAEGIAYAACLVERYFVDRWPVFCIAAAGKGTLAPAAMPAAYTDLLCGYAVAWNAFGVSARHPAKAVTADPYAGSGDIVWKWKGGLSVRIYGYRKSVTGSAYGKTGGRGILFVGVTLSYRLSDSEGPGMYAGCRPRNTATGALPDFLFDGGRL